MAREAGARASRSHRLGLPLAVCGALLILVAVCLRAFFPHEGEVFLRDAVVVRADSSRGIPVISDAAQHAAGDEMVAFVRRGQQAEIAALQLKRERIDNDAARLAEAPYQTDAAVVRRELELATERRALAQRRSMLEIEHRRLAQVLQSDLLDRRIRRHDVKAQLGEYDGKLQRMSALLNYDTILVEQSRELHESEFISRASLAKQQRDTQVSAAERQRLQIERKEKQALLEALDRGIASLETWLVEHDAHVALTTKQLDEELARLQGEQQVWIKQSENERLRCVRDRESEQRELKIRRQECDEVLAGIARRSSVVAPFLGKVLYRHEAPAAAQTGEPIMLFGPEGFVRARFRLSASDATSLEENGVVSLQVTAEGLLDRRMTGTVAEITPLTHDPGMVLAELSCAATHTQARQLAISGALTTRLLWAPSLFSDWFFVLGCVGLGCGLLMFLRPSRQSRASGSLEWTVSPAEATDGAAPGAKGAAYATTDAGLDRMHRQACRRVEDRRVVAERRSRGCRRRDSMRVTLERRSGVCRRLVDRRVRGDRRAGSAR